MSVSTWIAIREGPHGNVQTRDATLEWPAHGAVSDSSASARQPLGGFQLGLQRSNILNREFGWRKTLRLCCVHCGDRGVRRSRLFH